MSTPRTVIVTGGFGILGRAVAAAFAAQGDRVARIDFAATAPDTNPSTGGLDIGGVDLADSAAAQTAVDQVMAATGSISVLVNVAGGFVWQTHGDGDIAEWSRMHRMNVLTTATITRAALPALLASPAARIINIGAYGAANPSGAGMGAYAASKAGVHRLTESLAAELVGRDITVNAVLPSIIDTPTNRADMPDADTSQWVKAEALADVITFLASRAARSVSGALVPVVRGA